MDPMALLRIEEVELPPWQPVEETLGAAGVQEIPLPDGMGFGGADVWSGLSKDGTLYAVLCVERTGMKFGTYAFRLLPDGGREWIQLQEFTEGRVTVSPEGGAQILTWLSPNSRAVRRAQLPGYVAPEATGVATPISIVPTAPGGGGSGGPAVDEKAREYTSSVKKEAEKRDAALDARVKQLEARVSDASLLHIVWSVMQSKLEDGLYILLSSNRGGVVGQVQRIAAETAKAMRARGDI